MDSRLKVLFIMLIIIGIIYIVFYINAVASNKTIQCMLRAHWGKIPEREYEYEEYEAITRYFAYKKKQNPDDFYIDDITWNDLDMDSIFCMLNNTNSSVGEGYLYYLLRHPEFSGEILEEREKLYEFFCKNPEEREKLMLLFHDIGRTRKVAIMDYIDRLDNVPGESNWKHYLLIGLYGVGIGTLIMQLWMGIWILVIAFTIGVHGYTKRKGQIEPYIITFSYILKMLKNADKLCKINTPILYKYIEEIKAEKSKFTTFRAGATMLVSEHSKGGALLDVVLDYVRILFHLDLIKFNQMKESMKTHYVHIEHIMDGMGYIESAIAVASFRVTLPFYTIPQFTDSSKAFIEIEDGYHPLIGEPVANSIKAEQSILITGSNASGKSTFLKMTAINALLSQTVHTAVASSYKACFYEIYSSMALKDSLETKESYYIVEIKSLQRILNAGRTGTPILCFVDEVLRGTNTVERIAASAQILLSLVQEHIMCFAATHDIELTHILEQKYSNYHFQEDMKDNDIIFSYMLFEGRATSRNAIKLLGIIGYDKKIIDAAECTADTFLSTGEWLL